MLTNLYSLRKTTLSVIASQKPLRGKLLEGHPRAVGESWKKLRLNEST